MHTWQRDGMRERHVVEDDLRLPGVTQLQSMPVPEAHEANRVMVLVHVPNSKVSDCRCLELELSVTFVGDGDAYLQLGRPLLLCLLLLQIVLITCFLLLFPLCMCAPFASTQVHSDRASLNSALSESRGHQDLQHAC